MLHLVMLHYKTTKNCHVYGYKWPKQIANNFFSKHTFVLWRKNLSQKFSYLAIQTIVLVPKHKASKVTVNTTMFFQSRRRHDALGSSTYCQTVTFERTFRKDKCYSLTLHGIKFNWQFVCIGVCGWILASLHPK